jgi:GR25 family glycosyltransferase involved in LPS biosynthesis
MKIFVIHYSKLVDRKKHILEEFKKHNITEYEFVEKYDSEQLEDSDKLLFDTSLRASMMSFLNKTFYTYKMISENYENALIFEDDVILCENFTEILNQYMTQMPEDYDMLFIGDGALGMHIEGDKIIPNKNIYEKCLHPTTWGGDGASRCSDSYIISKKCANKLCEYIKNLNYKINIPGDWWINLAARDNNFKVYWAEPTIVRQANDIFQTSQ